MYIHRTAFGTWFACQNVAPLSPFIALSSFTSLYKQIDAQPLKGRCRVVYLGTNFHPVCVRKFERGEEFGTQAELPRALCFLGHGSTWQLWGTWLGWLSLQVCSFPAGDVLVCCTDLLLMQCRHQLVGYIKGKKTFRKLWKQGPEMERAEERISCSCKAWKQEKLQ